MLPMLHKHTLICAALVATMGLSACGSKKDVFTQPPTPETTQNPQGTSNETNVSGNDETNQKDVNGEMGDLPDPYSPPKNTPETPYYGDNEGQYPAPPPSIDTAPPTAGTNPNTQTPPRYTPPVTEVKPAPRPGEVVIPQGYDEDDKNNVDRRLSKRLTGAVTPEGLVYTSSATDGIIDFLRARNEKVSGATKQANLAAASSVVSAKLSVDSWKNAVVTIKVQEGRKLAVYNVSGTADGGPANSLAVVREGNGELTTGQRDLKGTLKCFDWDGGCKNKLVRLTIGRSPSSSVISIVFRDSVSDVHFDMPGQYANNPEYLYLREFMHNSINRANSENKLSVATMNSWEVVNGRSGVTLSMKVINGNLLAFAGPLLAPEAGTGVNIPLSRIARDREDSLDLLALQRPNLTYANWIGDARMTANNGLGQVRILLTMRPYSNLPQDKFAVTFMRKLSPIVELTSRNLDLPEL